MWGGPARLVPDRELRPPAPESACARSAVRSCSPSWCPPASSRSTRRSSRPRCRRSCATSAASRSSRGCSRCTCSPRRCRCRCTPSSRTRSAASRCCCSGSGCSWSGSVLCGVAWSMPALIVFRALQGLGAGAVQPMAITVAGDIYTVAERATAQGYIASVWALSSVVGPTLGGVFAELGLWRWIFFVNVPLCLLAGVLIARNLHETVERREHHIDYLGAVTADQRHDARPARRAGGRPGLGVELADEHRRVRGGRRAARRVRARRAARRRAGAAAVGAAQAPARHDDAALARRRRDPHRADRVRADLPDERARRVAAGRGPGAGRADHGLAAGREPLGQAVLPAARLPPDDPHRARPRRGGHRRARAPRAHAVGGRRRGHLLRHRHGHGPRRHTLADRRAGQRRAGPSAGSPPAPTCSPARWAARSAPRCSAPSPTG